MGHYHKIQSIISYNSSENSESDKNPILKDNTYNPEIIFLDKNVEMEMSEKYNNNILLDLQETTYEYGGDRSKQMEYIAKKNGITVNEVNEFIESMQEYMKKSGFVKKDKNGMWMLG